PAHLLAAILAAPWAPRQTRAGRPCGPAPPRRTATRHGATPAHMGVSHRTPALLTPRRALRSHRSVRRGASWCHDGEIGHRLTLRRALRRNQRPELLTPPARQPRSCPAGARATPSMTSGTLDPTSSDADVAGCRRWSWTGSATPGPARQLTPFPC